MTEKTTSALNTEATTNLADNTDKDISAEDVRNMAVNLADSAVNKLDMAADGQQTIFAPASAMTPNTTNGAESLTEEMSSNDVMVSMLAYDDTTRENACFHIQMPKSWDEGTIVAQFIWKCGATSGNVIWGIEAVAFGDDDALDAAFGTAVEVTDGAGSAADDVMISAETAALTVAGSPGAEELVVFKVYRDAADGSDTLSGDAELLGLKLHYTIDSLKDD